jgi:hypothetical protein
MLRIYLIVNILLNLGFKNYDLIDKSYKTSFIEKTKENLPHTKINIRNSENNDDLPVITKSINFYYNGDESQQIAEKIIKAKNEKNKKNHRKCC